MVGLKAIFFDLDHTLWDYETNSAEVLTGFYNQHISTTESELTAFLSNFTKVNDALWNKYSKGLIDKEVIRKSRFVEVLELSGINDPALAENLSIQYLFECPRKTHLFPGTIEVLEYLNKKYDTHILTNGFSDVQEVKLNNAGISKYFDKVITSESIGHKKPSKEFFDHAFEATKSTNSEAIMIGDNLKTDILGAHKAKMKSVYFNPSGYAKPHKATFEIKELKELLHIL